MNAIRERLESMPRTYLVQLAEDFEQFEKDGFIGDCLLRKEAHSYSHEGVYLNVVIVMNQVAFEAYRLLAGR